MESQIACNSERVQLLDKFMQALPNLATPMRAVQEEVYKEGALSIKVKRLIAMAIALSAGRTKLTLGPYLITEFIGQGGMGQVFKAVHDVMGRQCAVKVLPLDKLTKESRDSFIHEIRVQAELDSPYVVRAYDAGKDGKVHEGNKES